MLPGMGAGMNPRQMSMMMKKLGINVDEIEGVQKIVIQCADKDYVFTDASVSVMKAQGTETWQISGTPTVEAHEVKLAFSKEDVQMVMDQADCDEATAKQALDDAGGDIAEAIINLSE